MLTDTQIRRAKRSDKPRKLFDARGLYLHVMPNGGRYWRFNYQVNGRQKTLALGVYPDVPLGKARARLQEARELLDDGIDPSTQKQSVGKTFETIAREWFAHWRTGRNERHAHYVIKRLEADIFPEIGLRPLSRLQRLRSETPSGRSNGAAPWTSPSGFYRTAAR